MSPVFVVQQKRGILTRPKVDFHQQTGNSPIGYFLEVGSLQIAADKQQPSSKQQRVEMKLLVRVARTCSLRLYTCIVQNDEITAKTS